MHGRAAAPLFCLSQPPPSSTKSGAEHTGGADGLASNRVDIQAGGRQDGGASPASAADFLFAVLTRTQELVSFNPEEEESFFA